MFPLPNSLLAVALSAALAHPAFAQPEAASTRCVGSSTAGASAPTPADPYPLMAAGWGPELGDGFMASRWAEDWSGMAQAGRAPAGKAVPVGDAGRLTLSAELRLRATATRNVQRVEGRDLHQGQMRGVVGVDWTLDPHLRAYAELGVGHVDTGRATAAANFENAASLQQLFVDVRGHVGQALVGAMAGRQEFADGPRQLVSLSDGPNLHRSWNGVRVYGHGTRMRWGAFDLRATRPGRGGFDETVNAGERLRGATASFIVSDGPGPNTYFDPFWYRTDNPAFRMAGRIGGDHRDTYGARLWGRSGPLRYDWTAARQTGRTIDGRAVSAWALFAVQSLSLSESGWKPRLTSHVDVASGGGAAAPGTVRDFNPLYASSNYLGEGQFLGLSNLVMVAPGIALAPTARTSIAFEYGHARRLSRQSAIQAGGGRAYAGTQDAPGRSIGELARLTGTWSPNRHVSFRLDLEYLDAGSGLRRAGLGSGTYAYLDTTVRY
ncbi:MAG: alginate export family protein [Lysobacteraceae bacterium]